MEKWTWARVTFDKNGLVNSGNIEKVSMGNHGTIEFSVRSGFTGYGMSVYPAGLIIDGLDSDLSKTGLLLVKLLQLNQNKFL